MTRRFFALILAAAVASSVALTTAASSFDPPNLSGSWSGTITIPENGRRGEKSPLHATFKHVGDELTGTIGPEAKAQLEISKGRVEATKFGVLVTFDMLGPSFAMHFELQPASGVLRGYARLDNEKARPPV